MPDRFFVNFGSELRQPVVTKGALPLELDSGSGRTSNDQGLATTKFCKLTSWNFRVLSKDMVALKETELPSVNVPKHGFTDVAGPGVVRLVSWAALVLVAAAGCVLAPPGGILFAALCRADAVIHSVVLLPASRAGTGRPAGHRSVETPTLCGPCWCVVGCGPGSAPSGSCWWSAVDVGVWRLNAPPLLDWECWTPVC